MRHLQAGTLGAAEESGQETLGDENEQKAITADQPMRASVIRARGLTKVYRTGEVEVAALRGVDLDLAPGELVVLLGPSGSGKSTLLNILGGLDTPTEGHVYFLDPAIGAARRLPSESVGEVELTAASERELTRFRRHHVGFVFQFYNLVASLTALENVALVTEIADDPMKPEEALAHVGLENRVDHFPAQLSGGEQQRVAIARAIAKRPAILMCDEPTGALDSETGVLVLEAIEQVNRELGTTTALITHNAGIASMADRVLRFGDGRIIEVTENESRVSAHELSW